MSIRMLHAVGHASTNDPNDLISVVQSKLGPEASVLTPHSSAQEVIDRAQNTESEIHKEAAVLRGHITAPIPHVTQSVGHTWTVIEQRVQHFSHVAIPWLEEQVTSARG